MDLSKIGTALLVFLFAITTQVFGGVYEIKGPSVDGLLRSKRDHGQGSTGPVHTFVKTDKHANFKWGVRHHVGHKYAGH